MDDGYIRLGYAIIEQAVNDVKTLKSRGIIRPDGTVISNDEWPKTLDGKGKIVNEKVDHMTKPHEAVELLHWLREPVGKMPLNELLSGVGSGLSQADICKGIGI